MKVVFRPTMLALLASSVLVPVAIAAPALTDSSVTTYSLDGPISSESVMPIPMQQDAQDVVIGQQGQTLSDALRTAYSSNPTIQSARAELMATQERLPQALAGWKPSADATANITKTWFEEDGSDEVDSTSKGMGLNASQPLYRGGITTANTESARNAILAQRSFLNATEQDVLLSVVTAYMNVLRDQSLYQLAVNNKDVITKQLDASRARFEVGDVTRTDVSQSESRQAASEARRIDALGTLRSSNAVYQRVSGLKPGALSIPQIDLPLPASLDEAVEIAMSRNPSVVAASYLHRSAESDIRSVFGELLPQVGLFTTYDHTRDPFPGLVDHDTTKTIGVSATFPLYEAGSTRSRIRQAKSTAKQRMIEVDEARDLARQQTVSSWENLIASRAEIESRKAQVEATTIARDGVHKEAELGTRTILDALNADQELLDAQSALVTARRNEVVARYTLATTLGLMTPQTLGFPELMLDYNKHIDEITGKVFSTNTAFGAEIGKTGD